MAPASVVARIPVVGGLAYAERLCHVPSSFQATITVDPGQRYFRHAIAVSVAGEKVGYVAPEVAIGYFAPLAAAGGTATCPGRRAAVPDRETSGVALLLDFSSLGLTPSE